MNDTVSTDKSTWYKKHNIPKKSGGIRVIEEPAEWLKDVQRTIYTDILLPRFKLNEFAYGGVKKRNIAQAANLHVNNKIKLRIDIKDFFPSITESMITSALLRNVSILPDVAEYIGRMCTNEAGVLPQGGVTSTCLANIVCRRMHRALSLVASRMGLAFTAYVDDLIFSGDDPAAIINIATRIINSYGFQVKESKTVVMRSKQEVLGLCATPDLDHSRLPKYKRYRLKAGLHNMEKSLLAGESVSRKSFNKLMGWVAFAHMAGDQKSSMFAAQAQRIRELYNSRTETQNDQRGDSAG